MAALPDLDVFDELRSVAGFCDLSRELLIEVSGAVAQRRVLAGVTLVEQGAVAASLDVLARGAAKVVRTTTSSTGPSTVVLDVMRAPAVLLDAGLLDGTHAPASVVTMRASHLFSIDRRATLKLATIHPALARVLLGHLAHSVRRHIRRIDEVASGPVDDRVCHLLDGLAHDHGTPFGQGRFIAIPLRRRDIACMVNATTETVSRLLARLEREGRVRSTRDGIWWRGAEGAASSSAPEPKGVRRKGQA
jgi:CRP-like cAMP-binding protein